MPAAPSGERGRDLRRLLTPKSVALIGAGTWTDAVAAGAARLQYAGQIWRVHPTRRSTPETRYFRSVDELPAAPDSAFVAVPNVEVPTVVAALTTRGAGGLVCFSSGFSETATQLGDDLTRQLLQSAQDLPFFRTQLLWHGEFF